VARAALAGSSAIVSSKRMSAYSFWNDIEPTS
jgi:hypothetical protein